MRNEQTMFAKQRHIRVGIRGQLVGWLSLAALVALAAHPAQAMPLSADEPPRLAGGPDQPARNNIMELRRDDYISSDEDLARVLARLKTEADESIQHPANYISDDVPLEELIALIEQADKAQPDDDSVSPAPSETSEPSELSSADENECPICQEELEQGELKKLACAHEFHSDCLRQWFDRQVS